jgi:type I restriction enzyme S subunit
MVWNDELKREIPEGWEVKPLGKAINIIRGSSPRPIEDFLSDKGMPWVKISDATKSDSRFIIETKQFIIEAGVPNGRSVYPNTLILSNSASPAIPRIMKINASVHDGWLVIDKYSGGLTPEFMFHYFEYERPRILCLGSGSIFKNLKTDYLKDLKFIQPSKTVLDELSPQFKSISETIYSKTIENQKLTELRDWLLPMLMIGQVKVN